MALAHAAKSLLVSARRLCVITPSMVPTRTANVAPWWEVELLDEASFCLTGDETSLKQKFFKFI